MENRGSADNVAKDSSGAGGIQEHDFAEEFSSDLPSTAMPSSAPSCSSSPYASLSSPSAAKVDSSGAGGIQEHDFAEEFSSDLPSTAMPSSAPSGSSSPYASLSSPSAAKVDDRVRDTKKLEHALPTDPRMQLAAAGFGMVDSMGKPPVVYASNSDVGPGAFPVQSARSTATGRTVRYRIGSNANALEFATEESKQEDGVPNSAAAGIGVYAVEAQRVPDGDEDGTVMVAVAQHLTPLKWYQRRWIVAGLALLACGFAAAGVVMVALLGRQPSASPTSAPTSLSPEAIACNFLSFFNVTKCRSTFMFDSDNHGETTTGLTIPSEIGLLTQLRLLNFYSNELTSSIPSEIGLLTQLTVLSFYNNSLTSSIPSEIGLLTQLTLLGFAHNSLTSSIPSEIGLLTQLKLLGFAHNSLTSSIPSEIGLLTQLTWLGFYNNSLTSSIPSEIGLLTQLTELYFDVNQLTSSIPSEIGLLTLLEYLDSSNNTLTSSISSEIGLLTQLTVLSFYNNSLTSSIPSEIGLLTQLTELYFAANALTGTIPSSLCSLPSPPFIAIDCGEITCASGCCSNWITNSSCG